MLTRAEDHPLREACWIWPETYMYLYNHYAHFRRDFELETVPSTAPFFLTADKEYRLYVNGAYVCRGPARGYQASWPFDEVDLADRLRAGHNWIAVEAYQPGISTSQYLHATCSGFLCAACWDGLRLVSDTDWLMRRSPAQRTQTARTSLQTNFQEHVDLRHLDRNWITDPVPPTDWRAELFPPEGHQKLSHPFGQPPYDTLEPRGIPLLRERLRAPHTVTCTGYGDNADDVDAWENVSWGWVEDAKTRATWDPVPSIAGEADETGFRLTVPPTGDGAWRSVTLDMAEMVFGTLLVEGTGAQGGEVIDFQHDQCLPEGKPAPINPGGACLIAMANRLWCAPNSFAHAFFQPMGFRHLTVIVRNSSVPITLTLQVRTCEYPFAMEGTFQCADDTLKRIHAACRRTQQVCCADAYVDTPWREQAQWWGDARVQARNTFYLDGDARLLARGIRQIAAQRAPGNLTYGHAPTSMWWAVLPDFSLTWISTICDHVYQTGDTMLLREQSERIAAILAYFDSPPARGRHELLRYDPRFWLFCDWADLYKEEIPTFLNLLYLYTLQHLQRTCAESDLSFSLVDLEAAFCRHAEIVQSHLFDPVTHLFHAGLDAQGNPAATPSVHDQTLALMTGLVPEAHPQMLEKRILPYLRDEGVEGAQPSAFWCTYVLEEAGKRGYAAEAIHFIRTHWEPMLPTGTTWEHFSWKPTGGASCSHAWSAHPAYHLVNLLAGIRQTAPAWQRVEIRPALLPDIPTVESTVPTPLGLLYCHWEHNEKTATGRFRIPAGMNAVVWANAEPITLTGPTETEKTFTRPR